MHSSPWSADRGDGTYRNPVLHADWSDPDAIRVGDDYFLTASSFHRVPGLPVLHSRDLVNWSIIGHALPRLEPEEDFRTPQHGCGVWAPALRHHDGKFWIFYPDPDRGISWVTATDPAGPWSAPHLLKPGRGLIDPCPLWDSDGSAYLVHAWAKSRAGINNRLTCHRMSPDGKSLLDEGTVVIDGDALPGYRTLEGPKCYREGGWYWIFAPAGGVPQGWQTAFRSRSVFGPYEERIVLEQGGTDVNGPHQGAWVRAADGRDWFLHFQDKGPFGRVVHLQPMTWDSGGWPVIGDAGRPVAVNAKPADGAPCAPATSDDFEADAPGPQWTWSANPEPGWAEAVPGQGLRLACAPRDTGDLRELPNLLGQLLPSDAFRAVTSLRLDGTAPGTRAGLTVLGYSYAWIGLEHTEDGVGLACRSADVDAAEDDSAPVSAVPRYEDGTTPQVTVGVDVTPDGRCQFLAAMPGEELRPVGAPFEATPGRWVGATLGLFAAAAIEAKPDVVDVSTAAASGGAEFDSVRITAAACADD